MTAWQSRPCVSRITLFFSLSLIAWLPAAAYADGPATQPDLNELLHISPAPDKNSNHTPAATQPAQDESRKALEHELAHAVTEHPGDAFTQAVTQMALVSSHIKVQHRIDIQDRREQKQIIEKLDQVIAAAQKRQQANKSQSSKKKKGEKQQTGQSQMKSSGHSKGQKKATGNKAANKTPSSAGDHGPSVNDQPLHDQRAQWGNLPARLRDQLSDGLQERFSPLYQKLTEDYYKKLAQQQSHAAGNDHHD